MNARSHESAITFSRKIQWKTACISINAVILCLYQLRGLKNWKSIKSSNSKSAFKVLLLM